MKPLPRAVVTLGWISLLTDIASEMIYPVMPLFLLTLTSAPGLALGVIEGSAELVVAIMKGWSGWHSDQVGRRVPYVRLGYTASALAKPFMALARVWGALFAARMIDRVGKGLRTSARDALLADATDSSERGRVFGFHRAMDTTGAAIGVLLATALLYALPGQYRLIIALSVVPGLVAVALCFTLNEPPPSDDGAAGAGGDASTFGSAFWTAVAALVVFGVANSSDTFLLLRVRDSGWADWQVGLAYALFNFTYAAGSYPLGRLSDRVGRWPIIAAGWTLYAGVYAGFASLGGHAFWALFALYGFYMALTEGVGKALVADLAPPSRKGTAMGIVYMGVGLANLGGSVAAGLLFDRVSPQSPFWLGCVLAIVALAFLACARALSSSRRTKVFTPPNR